MAFRDDRDALRAKSDALAGELGDAKSKLAQAEQKLAAHEAADAMEAKELDGLRDEVDRLRKQAGLAPLQPRKARLGFVLAGAVAGVALIGVAMSVILVRVDEAPVVPAAFEVPPEPVVLPQETPLPPRIPELPPMPSEPVVAGDTGTLSINTLPWSQVSVDGRMIGNTPLMDVQLSAGRHRVTLVNPDLNIRHTVSVTITAGETTTRVVRLPSN